MFEKLKQQPLIGLTIALAAAYVIAHFTISFLEDLPSRYEQDSDMYIAVTFWVLFAAAVIFVCTKRKLLADSIRPHPRVTAAVVVLGLLISVSNAARVIATELALGINRTAAQIRGTFVGTFDLVVYLLLAALVFTAAKTFRLKRSSRIQPQT